ncbi:MAG TPA: preprotein translocase subunit SecG [Verrucomicrobiae bacterium]|jgi:preprotein translocase subunit SecG
MSVIIYFLVILLVVMSLFLVMLILLQLPKKDAGAGLAFGGGTADALFGAGSGTALTKITKWVTVAFVLLAVILGALETRLSHGNQSEFLNGVEQQQQMQGTAQQPRVAPEPATAPPASSPSAAPAMPLYSATNTAPAATPNGK